MTDNKYDDLFQDIPGDSANVMMSFPPEILEESGWEEGTELVIEVINGSLHIRKKDGTD